MVMSDEALLSRLNEHPELLSRVESMLPVVEDEMGNAANQKGRLSLSSSKGGRQGKHG